MSDTNPPTTPDPLDDAKRTVTDTLAAAQNAAGEAADNLQDAARGLGSDLESGMERAEAAIQRVAEGAGAAATEPLLATPNNEDDRLYATLAHVSIFVLPIIGPLLVTALKKPETAFVKEQAKEALNYQISSVIATFAFFAFAAMTLGIGACLMPVLFALYISPILAAVKVNNGEGYRYPYTLRLIK